MEFIDTVKWNIISTTKTNNVVLDFLISSTLLWFIGYIYNHHTHIIVYCKKFFFRDNTMKYNINLIGSTVTLHSNTYQLSTVNNLYTEEIRAMLYFFANEIGHNQDITKLKHCYSTNHVDNTYLINQSNQFLIDKELDIHGTLYFRDESKKTDRDVGPEIEHIQITISSNQSPLMLLKQWINNKKDIYLMSRTNSRYKKLYTYTILNVENNTWRENEFLSHRSFENMFFEGKEQIVSKIDFFLNSKEWYADNGIPYTLGIGLYGPPGTGKTSFIKSLSIHTKRHIVVLSLKGITTISELEQCFFECRYSIFNTPKSIGFDKKIIVMEDIDCLGDLVKNRQQMSGNDGTRNLIQYLASDKMEFLDESEIKKLVSKATKESEKISITLDDLLNLWDGICETPGRIMVISSNCYDELDPALVRPGRIDITIGLQNVSHPVLCDMFRHFYKIPINETQLLEIKENYFSPAEIINIYHNLPNDPLMFIKELIERSMMKTLKNKWIVKND